MTGLANTLDAPQNSTIERAGGRTWCTGVALYPILCGVAVLFCIALAHPFANSPFNDDWSYSYVALKFAETGRFHYSGWGSPTILFQTLWGAAWIRIFGFSFDVLRAATIPFSVGFVLMVYALGRRIGLKREFALFGALTVGTSPLFVPLAATFMTDVYGCFFITVCIYAAIASAQAGNSATAQRWLWILALSGIVGGSNRQTVWVAPLLLIPYLLWTRRSDKRFAAHAMVALATTVATSVLVLIAFSQPYAVFELSPQQIVMVLEDNWIIGVALTADAFLSVLLVALPVFLHLCPLWRRLSRYQFLWCCLIATAGTAVLPRILGTAYGLAPFLGNILTPVGIMRPGQDALGVRPIILPMLLRIAVTWLLLFSVASFTRLYPELSQPVRNIPRNVFVILSAGYILLLIPGAFIVLTYDRYMLPLFPLLVTVVLWGVQSSGRSAPAVAWTCLALFAGYSVAITHDYSSGLRARASAAETMKRSGVGRDQISAGFEYDGWTQLQKVHRIEVFHFNEHFEWNTTDTFGFWTKTSAIKPAYVVSYWPVTDLPVRRLATVPFAAWLPPFRRAVVVLKREDLPKERISKTMDRPTEIEHAR